MPPEFKDAPLRDDEILLRRIPEDSGWYNKNSKDLSPDAFNPRPKDTNGISLTRLKFVKSGKDEAEKAPAGRKWYVVQLSVLQLRKLGVDIVLAGNPENPGHVVLPQLKFVNPLPNAAEELKFKLAKTTWVDVEGPYEGKFKKRR